MAMFNGVNIETIMSGSLAVARALHNNIEVWSGWKTQFNEPDPFNDGSCQMFWQFDDETATDITGNGHDGTLMNSPTFVPGVNGVGKAASFNGDGSNISVDTITLNGSWSVSFWIKLPNDTDFDYQTLFMGYSDYNTNRCYMWFYKNGFFQVSDSSESHYARFNMNIPMFTLTGEWKHVAVVYDDTTKFCFYYLDGILVNYLYSKQELNQYTFDRIGGCYSSGYSKAYFAIDQIRVFNKALTYLEVLSLNYEVQVKPAPYGSLDFFGDSTEKVYLGFDNNLTDKLSSTTPSIVHGTEMYTDGVVEEALHLTASDETILQLPDLVASGELDTNTVVMWVKAPVYYQWGFLFGAGDSKMWYEFGYGSNSSKHREVCTYTSTTDGSSWNAIGWANPLYTAYHSNEYSAFIDGSYHMFAATIDEEGRWRAYYDGLPIGYANAGKVGYSGTDCGEIQIGNRSDGSWNYLDVDIDELKIFTRPLTSQEIFSLYRSYKVGKPNVSGTDPFKDGSQIAFFPFNDSLTDLVNNLEFTQKAGTVSYSTSGANIKGPAGAKALELDGSQELETDLGSLQPTGPYAVAFWVRMDTIADYQQIIAFGSDATNDNAVTLYYHGGSGGRMFGFNTWNSDCYGFNYMEAFIGRDEWVMIVANIHPGELNKNTLWVNGVPMPLAAIAGTWTPTATPNSKFYISYPYGSSNQHFTGGLRNLRVFNRTLKPNEVYALLKEEAPVALP